MDRDQWREDQGLSLYPGSGADGGELGPGVGSLSSGQSQGLGGRAQAERVSLEGSVGLGEKAGAVLPVLAESWPFNHFLSKEK